MYGPLSEIGDPGELAGKDKLYTIQPSSQGGECQHGSAPAALPIPLETKERKLPLVMGPDAHDTDARFMLTALTCNSNDSSKVWFRLNHTLLQDSRRDGDRYRVAIPTGILRAGENELSIWCDAAGQSTQRPILVQQVFVQARYGAGTS